MDVIQAVERYSLRLLINGIPDFLVYEVELEDAERLQAVLALREEELREVPFFCFSSKEGIEVALSVPDIQMVNFLWDRAFGSHDERTEPGTEIEIYFRGSPQPFRTSAAYPEEVSRIFVELESFELLKDSFLFFDDEDGEAVCFCPKHVVLMPAPHWLLEEGAEPEGELEE